MSANRRPYENLLMGSNVEPVFVTVYSCKVTNTDTISVVQRSLGDPENPPLAFGIRTPLASFVMEEWVLEKEVCGPQSSLACDRRPSGGPQAEECTPRKLPPRFHTPCLGDPPCDLAGCSSIYKAAFLGASALANVRLPWCQDRIRICAS